MNSQAYAAPAADHGHLPSRDTALSDAARRLFAHGRRGAAQAVLHGIQPGAMGDDALRLLNRLKRRPGVSVVMPSHSGASRIGRALDSIARQTLHPGMFELIVVLNGPDDGTQAMLTEFARQHPQISTTVLRSPQIGASHARNLGLGHLRFDHATFLDDDDYISPGFLEALYRCAGDGDRMVLAELRDFDADGVRDSAISQRIRAAFDDRREAAIGELHGLDTALTMTCIKLFPAYYADLIRFDPDLASGEDVVFWTEALSRFQPRVCFTGPNAAVYYRELRDGSVSRQAASFQFNVLDRLKVIARLDRLHQRAPGQFTLSKILSGVGFMVAYLRQNPQDHQRVVDAVTASGLSVTRDMLRYLNEKLRDKLVISYCFPPSLDTASIVAAKRLALAGEPFDVISNDMSAIRKTDSRLLDLCHDLVGREIVCKSAPRWSIDAASGIGFAEQSRRHALALNEKNPYRTLYSRAMWPASHLAGASIKAALPHLRWQAEFSDPLAVDIMGVDRPGEIDPDWLEQNGITAMIREAGFPIPLTRSVMKWCEYVAYALADELWFTNANQMDYMLSRPWIVPLRDRIAPRAVICRHPTLPDRYYDMAEDRWTPQTGRFSIAYFGNFYQNRGLQEVLTALSQLDPADRRALKLDIYCSANPELNEMIGQLGLTGTVEQFELLPFLEFLARSRKYDMLLVNDAVTAGIKPFNPYLPSKLSDYLGAKRPIWRLAEPGSPMSGVTLPDGSQTSRLGDVASYRAALQRMAGSLVPA
ncbi:Glycosyltransferase involved in cell wall bisynthesis [Paracoccus isoporae]|uniref:Glycosyltransferase involved in cell wall bisynthesis n=1 Tax=Paracoccus isoporae TaxID=591205 RepID=A0A1G6X128_9RHOB|nr:glycosyltransferase [Paracoccus isoporae]SDD71801.1 Glycosyltransferase involved in cell wall bisynthesis [Paracoccus isoporae]